CCDFARLTVAPQRASHPKQSSRNERLWNSRRRPRSDGPPRAKSPPAPARPASFEPPLCQGPRDKDAIKFVKLGNNTGAVVRAINEMRLRQVEEAIQREPRR